VIFGEYTLPLTTREAAELRHGESSTAGLQGARDLTRYEIMNNIDIIRIYDIIE
jgi:hypothetical protein